MSPGTSSRSAHWSSSASSPGSSRAGRSTGRTCGSRPACCAAVRCATRSRRSRRSTPFDPGWPGRSGSPSCGSGWAAPAAPRASRTCRSRRRTPCGRGCSALSQGAHEETPEPTDRELVRVPRGRVAVSLLLSGPTVVLVALPRSAVGAASSRRQARPRRGDAADPDRRRDRDLAPLQPLLQRDRRRGA